MIKRLVTTFLLLAGSAGLCHAYNGWGIYGTYWDTDEAGGAGGAGVKVSIEMVPGVQMELRATYLEDLEKNGADIEVLPLEAGLALVQPVGASVDWLAGGGLGYVLADGDGDPDNEIGFYLATGLEWRLQPQAALFGELLYRVVGVDDAGPNGEDVDLDGLGVAAGLLIRW